MQNKPQCYMTIHLVKQLEQKNSDHTKWWQGCEKLGLSYHWWECKMVKPC